MCRARIQRKLGENFKINDKFTKQLFGAIDRVLYRFRGLPIDTKVLNNAKRHLRLSLIPWEEEMVQRKRNISCCKNAFEKPLKVK
jgi:hypothetical protein